MRCSSRSLAILLAASLLLAQCGGEAPAPEPDEGQAQVAAEKQAEEPREEPAAQPAAAESDDDYRLLRRVAEPREGAFSICIPEGWTFEGGIVRMDPLTGGGPAQAMEAKVDVTIKSDEEGSVMLRRVPDWYYCDVRHMPAGQMGMFPNGSDYQGMTVMPLQSAVGYLREMLFPELHPRAKSVRVSEEESLPKLAGAVRERMQQMVLAMQFNVDAGYLRVTYEEGGVEYEEVLFTLIEDRGPLAGGQWANRETFVARAPSGEYAEWEPVFDLMLSSVQIDMPWLMGELRGQLERQGIWDRVRRQVDQIDREITAHRRKTNAEIHNDVFLTLTEQEEYVNPHTGEVEIGTNQLGDFRWVTDGGDVLYSKNEDFDPNIQGALNRGDWERSPVRER